MNEPFSLKLLRPVYDALMSAVIPLTRSHHRLEEGYDERILAEALPSGVDLWIQAASVGEAHLALQLLENLPADRRMRVLATTCTRQGRDILDAGAGRLTGSERPVTLQTGYLPFDKPSLMRRAVDHVQPRAMVLLETELWPGLLWALRRRNAPTLVVNGRMRTASLARYLLADKLFAALSPSQVLAVSEPDARRFQTLFPDADVEVSPNMKFDRFTADEPLPYTKNPLASLFRPTTPLLVLGSVREQEKDLAAELVQRVRAERPTTVTAVFPRHMHHVESFAEAFARRGVDVVLRSQAEAPVPFGSTLLWDAFGELTQAYWLARAVFVGGSLAPLGGQNFLEPLACGVVPVIGPHWSNFAWVGEGVLEQGLVVQAASPAEAAGALVEQMGRSQPREDVREAALEYVRTRQGGTQRACSQVARWLGSR
jgi:3-deoxy-D-manno-octulosonic-acid transferase